MEISKTNTNENEAIKVITNKRDSAHAELCERIQYALKHRATCIYNGNDEVIEVPIILGIEQVYSDFDPTRIGAKQFIGWSDFKQITVVYFDRATLEQCKELMAQFLDKSTIEKYNKHSDWFSHEDTIAVRIDDEDGSWYEHIINHTKAI